jgi:hypothetical protein
MNHLGGGFNADDDIIRHDVALQSGGQSLFQQGVGLDDQIRAVTTDKQGGTKFSLGSQNTGGQGGTSTCVILKWLEIAGDLTIEIAKGIPPRKPDAEAGSETESSP